LTNSSRHTPAFSAAAVAASAFAFIKNMNSMTALSCTEFHGT
jgi:hypothetical protein